MTEVYVLMNCSTILQVLKVLLTAVSSTKFRGNDDGERFLVSSLHSTIDVM